MTPSTAEQPELHSPRKEAAELGLGCWAFGDSYWKEANQSGREDHNGDGTNRRGYARILGEAFALGIRHFDTAQGYGRGVSEQVTGQQLRKKREKVSIATKTFYRPADTMRKGIEKSLKRLSTDYIDIFYLHWPKPGRDLRPHIEELEKARRDGLIRRIGVSNFQASQIEPLLEAGRIDYCQFGYSLLWRNPEECLVPFCLEHDIRMVTYSSLAQGLLAHPPSWAERLSPKDPRRRMLLLKPPVRREIPEVHREFYREMRRRGIAPARAALAWNLSRPWARYVLFGARNPAQLRDCVAASKLNLPPDLLGKIDRLSSRLVKLFRDEDNIFGHQP